MKTVYIILFLIDTLVLVLLAFLFLKGLDSRENGFTLTLLIAGISLSTTMLAYLLYSYIKQPVGKNRE
jgi:peptidoglycan/LPS O-acetylase OafA/YrhL